MTEVIYETLTEAMNAMKKRHLTYNKLNENLSEIKKFSNELIAKLQEYDYSGDDGIGFAKSYSFYDLKRVDKYSRDYVVARINVQWVQAYQPAFGSVSTFYLRTNGSVDIKSDYGLVTNSSNPVISDIIESLTDLGINVEWNPTTSSTSSVYMTNETDLFDDYKLIIASKTNLNTGVYYDLYSEPPPILFLNDYNKEVYKEFINERKLKKYFNHYNLKNYLEKLDEDVNMYVDKRLTKRPIELHLSKENSKKKEDAFINENNENKSMIASVYQIAILKKNSETL